jgi:hypothetical protein
MTLNRRIELLEDRLFPKRVHVYSLDDGETEPEATKRYCMENGLELKKFENGDYGQVIVINRYFLSPGDFKDSD